MTDIPTAFGTGPARGSHWVALFGGAALFGCKGTGWRSFVLDSMPLRHEYFVRDGEEGRAASQHDGASLAVAGGYCYSFPATAALDGTGRP